MRAFVQSVGIGIIFAACGGTGTAGFDPPPSTSTGTTPDKGADAGSVGVPGTTATGDDGGTGTGNAIDAAPPPIAQPGPLALGLTISEVAIFQAVKIDVVKDGAAVTKANRNASIAAKRDAIVRVYVTPGASYTPHAVNAELHLLASDGTKLPAITDTKTITLASTDDVTDSTFNLTVPGDSLPEGATWTVALRETSGDPASDPATSPAQYPASGTPEPLLVTSTGDQLKILVVPVKYGADGSNRIPDISPAQLETYRQQVYSIYPAAKVEITARAPFAYGNTIDPGGDGFSQVLQAIVGLRQDDGAPDDLYYYGALAPAGTFDAYCGSGCVTGLSGVGEDPSDASVRASVGIGFTGPESAITMAHEVGHAHGRQHSPCGGASEPDLHYPYPGGGIGVWGYNLLTKAFIAPTSGKDIMGYCTPEWIADYTYQALFDRMAIVNMAMDRHGPVTPQPYRFVSVGRDGSVKWGSSVTMRSTPYGELHTVSYLAKDGTTLETVSGHYYAYDHIPGGYMLVPEGPPAFTKITIAGLNKKPITRLTRTF